MINKSLALLSAIFLAVVSVPAANIYWVSFHSADETPTANAAAAGFTNAPDIGYTRLLRANGHTVTRYVTTGTPDTALLNTADLVIISRSVPSGHYQNEPSPTDWNGITAPMIVLNGYLTRGSRLGFTTGDTIPDVNTSQIRLRVNTPAHPIFNGVSLTNGLMVNPYAQIVTYTNATNGQTIVQRGISVNTSAVIAGGATLAVDGTAGDAAVNGMIIGEFAQGLTSQRANTFGAKRLVFFSGSREQTITSEGAGIYDLLPDGEKLFLNSVNYMLSSKTSVPGVAITPGGTTTNLYAGDAWTFTANAWGADPITYQWYKGQQEITGATTPTLTFASLTAADAGDYTVKAMNPNGSATSAVARLEFAIMPSANITNGIVTYWPLDQVTGTKTPDRVSGYDMTLVNMGATNLVAGRWGQAFSFDNASQQLLERLDNAGDSLPIYQHPNFSVSLWVNAGIQQDHRVFAEGSTTDTDPMLSIGTANNAADTFVDMYIRNDTGGTVGDHRHGTLSAFDSAWHNIVYVQRDVGNDVMKAQLWVDGVLDPVTITPVRPLTANTTAIGALRRSSSSAWFTGMIDEVATWNRALTPQEIQILQVTAITNPPSRTQPLVITTFKADLPAVVTNGTTTLRWDVSRDASQITISPLGDVTSQTVAGTGSRSITLTQAVQYVLTIQRGVESLSATTSVGVVQGVNPGWTLLDNFDLYSPGNLSAKPYWNDVTGTAATIVDVKGNPALRTAGLAFLNLRNLAVNENQARTLFFRVIPGAPETTGTTNIVGLTDKSQRSYADEFINIGPVVYPTALTNDLAGITTNAWYLGARNGYFGGNSSPAADYPVTPPVTPFEAGTVYNVWIDVTNAPLSFGLSDYFTVYVQKEGATERTVLFQDYQSDRDISYQDPVLGGITPVLDKLVVIGNSGTYSALFDDFYLSNTGYNATLPRPYGFTGQVGPLPALQISWSGNQVEIRWTTGTLQESSSVTGGWTDVQGATAPSYKVTPGPGSKFYRARP